MRIKDCPKTMTGKHKWKGGYRQEAMRINGMFGMSADVSAHWIEKQCSYCGIIDDRKGKNE